MKGERCKSNFLVHLLLTLTIPDLIHSRSYPIFTSKRFGKAGPPAHVPAFVPIMFPAAQIPNGFEVPDYDDNYIPFEQMEENENYPLAPVYGYLRDQSGSDSFIDYEDEGNGERDYPYGRETWFKDEEKDNNVAFLRNLILSEMDQDSANSEANSEIVYGTPVEYSPDYVDNERDRTWYYGVPVYAEGDSTRSRKDDSVRELESLTRQMKEEEAKAFQYNNEEILPLLEDEILRNQLQKKINRSGRKNNIPLREGFKMNEKRFFTTKKFSAKAGTRQNHHLKAKDSDRKNKTEATTSVPLSKTSPTGQKEYVLPRPASPVRKPLQRGIYTRNTGKVDVYEAIKKLLAMEEGLQKESRPRIQKRFVLSEDQLTSQLSGLKKIAV